MPINSDGLSTSNELPSLEYDQDATSKFKIHMQGTIGPIELQFPPKITSDGKASKWQENHFNGYEEYAIWMGAYARNVNVELNYVVWGKWNVDLIQKQIKNIKLHFYVGGGLPPGNDKFPFFFMEGWRIIDGTNERVPFRLLKADITYSRECVGSGVDYWPLHTKVNMDCKLFTRSGMTPDHPKHRQQKFNGLTLPASANPEWA